MKHNNTRVALTFAMGLSALHSFPLMAPFFCRDAGFCKLDGGRIRKDYI